MEQLRPDSPDGNGDEEELEDEEDGDEMPEAQPHGGGMPVDDILNDPIVMAHIMRLMRAQAATARNAKKQERKVAPAVVVAALRSRRSELRSLAAASLSPLLARLGHNVWTMIAGHLEARDLVRLSSACWYFRALTEDDSFWERIFARQVGGVSLVTRCCTSFRERFFLCQPMADLETALATGEDGDEILLCPGVYEMRGERDPFIDSAFTVENSVHIRGCMFNQKFAADLNWNHPQDMNHLGTGNVIIRVSLLFLFFSLFFLTSLSVVLYKCTGLACSRRQSHQRRGAVRQQRPLAVLFRPQGGEPSRAWTRGPEDGQCGRLVYSANGHERARRHCHCGRLSLLRQRGMRSLAGRRSHGSAGAVRAGAQLVRHQCQQFLARHLGLNHFGESLLWLRCRWGRCQSQDGALQCVSPSSAGSGASQRRASQLGRFSRQRHSRQSQWSAALVRA